MKRNLILSIIFALLLFTSCYDNSLQPCKRSPFKIVLSDSTTIDGGVFFIKTSHRENPSNVDVQVDLFYQDWKGIVPIKLDSFEINDYDVRLNISPYTSHTWNVTANPKYNVPSIEKTIPGIEPIEMTSHNMNDTISMTGTIKWVPASDTSHTYVVLFVSKHEVFTKDTTFTGYVLFTKTADNGTFTFKPSDFLGIGIKSGDSVDIEFIRIWRMLEKIDGKNYLFATSTSKVISLKLH
jgi:hypothetical protein